MYIHSLSPEIFLSPSISSMPQLYFYILNVVVKGPRTLDKKASSIKPTGFLGDYPISIFTDKRVGLFFYDKIIARYKLTYEETELFPKTRSSALANNFPLTVYFSSDGAFASLAPSFAASPVAYLGRWP